MNTKNQNNEVYTQYEVVQSIAPLKRKSTNLSFILIFSIMFVVGVFMSLFFDQKGINEIENVYAMDPEIKRNLVEYEPLKEFQPEVKSVTPYYDHQQLSNLFAPSVLAWEDEISIWAITYNIDPNLIASVMQIESCGDPNATSWAGANGLFQVMPFHFNQNEDMFDPQTNANTGLSLLAALLNQYNGNVYLALAAYNGGPSVAAVSYYSWPAETQNYVDVIAPMHKYSNYYSYATDESKSIWSDNGFARCDTPR